MDIRDKPRRDRENRVVAVRDIAWRKNKAGRTGPKTDALLEITLAPALCLISVFSIEREAANRPDR